MEYQYTIFTVFPTKSGTWRNDADDGDAPTTLAPWSSPSLNAHREKISRSGHHTPHSDNKNWSKFDVYTKIDRRSFNSIGWAGVDSPSLISPQFRLLNPLFPTRPSIRTPIGSRTPDWLHARRCRCGRSTLWPVTHSAWSSHSCHIWDFNFFNRIFIKTKICVNQGISIHKS